MCQLKSCKGGTLKAIIVDVLTLTASELQRLLSSQAVTSAEIVQLYLAQIAKHNHAGLKLNAVISVADEEAVLEQARRLDTERLSGNLRGSLHGVPILLKVPSKLAVEMKKKTLTNWTFRIYAILLTCQAHVAPSLSNRASQRQTRSFSTP